MARHIRQITEPIAAYVAARFVHSLRGNKNANQNQLPPHLEWAKVRGEALLVNRFFSHFERHHVDDIDSQLFFWNQLRQNTEVLPVVSEMSGLIAVFKKQVGQLYLEQTAESDQHYIAYCCLLWDIHQKKDNSLLDISTFMLFKHFSATIFPAKAKRDDVKKLTREIQKILAQQWNIRPEIKESFVTGEDAVSFSLIARMGGYSPCELITLKGKRLKPTRLKAYQNVIKQLTDGALNLDMPKALFSS